MLLQENLDTWILPLRPFLGQICHQFMLAVFMICVVGGNLSSGAAMKYSYIIGWHDINLLTPEQGFCWYS